MSWAPDSFLTHTWPGNHIFCVLNITANETNRNQMLFVGGGGGGSYLPKCLIYSLLLLSIFSKIHIFN